MLTLTLTLTLTLNLNLALALTLTLSERNALLWRPVNYNLAGTASGYRIFIQICVFCEHDHISDTYTASRRVVSVHYTACPN